MSHVLNEAELQELEEMKKKLRRFTVTIQGTFYAESASVVKEMVADYPDHCFQINELH
jgi:uncharacterized membrane-anchored protein YhcB (DUF1043 family)